MFLSYDGFYFYNGANSFKISDKITSTLDTMNKTRYSQAVSLVQKNKNRYWCTLIEGSGTENDKVFVWDYFNNAWSIYDGIDANSMATFYVTGTDERPYWADYRGHAYRSDTGTTDNPMNNASAIAAHYWTNWKHYDDLVDKKGVAHATIYHQITSATLSFSFSYDFDTDAQFTQSIDLSTSADVYGTGLYGTATYAQDGGAVKRRDLTGRGRVIRFKFSNATASETFQVDGFGTLPHLETVE